MRSSSPTGFDRETTQLTARLGVSSCRTSQGPSFVIGYGDVCPKERPRAAEPANALWQAISMLG
jgi:hypothetical protein